MRVQFVWPNFDCPIGKSIGVSYLSGALKQAGHDTRIVHICEWLDYPFDLDRVVGHVKDYDPDLIAISTGRQSLPRDAAVAPDASRRSWTAPIIFGGIHTTLNTPAVMKENPWIDFANVGEGDDSIVDLVDRARTRAATPRTSRTCGPRRTARCHRIRRGALKDITDAAVDGPRRLGVQAHHRKPPRLGQRVHEPRLPVPLHLLPQQRRRQGAAGGLRHQERRATPISATCGCAASTT